VSEERITEIEIKLAHQEVTIDELNQVVTRQQSEISQLYDFIKLLKSKIDNFQTNEKASQESPPPHY